MVTNNRSLTLTLSLARAAGSDAANRQMRAEGRTSWSVEDYNLAARTMNALIPSSFVPVKPERQTLKIGRDAMVRAVASLAGRSGRYAR